MSSYFTVRTLLIDRVTLTLTNGNIGEHACRPEVDADRRGIDDLVAAAFGRRAEADLVSALRRDRAAWIPQLSFVAVDDADCVAAYALLTRCRVGDRAALALAPCAVWPSMQNSGLGTLVTRAALDAARGRVEAGAEENLVVVLGHPGFYPRFGFRRASEVGVAAPFEVPDEALMFLALDTTRSTPAGMIDYPPAFGA